MSAFFVPRLTAVEALAPYRLRTYWNTGEVLDVDIGERLRRIAALAPVLDPTVFTRVHLAEGGGAIEWFDTEFGADNVYAWAKEQAGEVSHEMFADWMRRNRLSPSEAADALGISLRRVSDYLRARKPIPRAIWLACLGWEATRPTQGKALPRQVGGVPA